MCDKNQDTIERDEQQNGETVEQETVQELEQDSELEKCQKEIVLWKDQCKRISAEFENFKRRTERDQKRWTEMAKESMLLDMVQFVDDFDRALQQEKGDNSGIQMVYQALLKLLEKHHVVAIESYEQFDPHMHEAVMQVDAPDKESGTVVEVFSKGFKIQDRILRPAKVSVAK